MPLSDGPFLAFSAGAILLLACAGRSEKPAGWLIASGLLAGFSYCIRYAGLALIGAGVLFLLVQALWQDRRTAGKNLLIWLAAMLIAAEWLVARNLSLAGRLNPYDSKPSSRGLFRNLTDVANTILGDMLGLGQGAGDGLSWCALAFIFIALVVGAVLVRRRYSGGEMRLWLSQCAGMLPGALYVLCYVGLMVASRTWYGFEPTVESRYMVQVYWLLWIGAALAIAWAVRSLPGRTAAPVGIATAMFGMLALQSYAQVRRIQELKADEALIMRPQVARRLAAMIPENQIVMTDVHAVLRMFGGAHARMFPMHDNGEQVLTEDEIQEAGNNGLLWGIIIADTSPCEKGDYGMAIRKIAHDPESVPGFEKIDDDSGLLVLKWVGVADEPEPPPATQRAPGAGGSAP